MGVMYSRGKILEYLPEFEGKKVIYGETTRLGDARLQQEILPLSKSLRC